MLRTPAWRSLFTRSNPSFAPASSYNTSVYFDIFHSLVILLLDGSRSFMPCTFSAVITPSQRFFLSLRRLCHKIGKSQPIVVPFPSNSEQMRQETLMYLARDPKHRMKTTTCVRLQIMPEQNKHARVRLNSVYADC